MKLKYTCNIEIYDEVEETEDLGKVVKSTDKITEGLIEILEFYVSPKGHVSVEDVKFEIERDSEWRNDAEF